MSLFLRNVQKSSEISDQYCQALTKLSTLFFTYPGRYGYIGFFDKELLEKKKEINHTKEEGKNERQKAKK